ncbi:hypothetical protein JX265_009937 [Neoarthrinium moseri]|uniref:DUF8021 domain-containing protein n=1 Tax=Neoarthrinium moseri TaxID=1658444 RepID=A0A9Q0AL80_9PEZI|nr:hypothetical protein JX266_012336 [Neoarthrinium moseri]KAI1860538.1 hypothetical protein JX265_009937 [Neoarthrinium moseri]
MLSRIIASISFGASVLGAPTSHAAACDIASLKAATDSYISAQTAGDSTKLAALSSSPTYTENFKTADLTKGILSQSLKIDHNHSLHDTTACATYTELIITDSKHPSVTGTQMYFTDGKISKIETIVTDKGDWLFDVAGTLKWASQEHWDEIPVEKRDSRQAIQAAADAYADIFNNKSVVVPWGQPCARLEGGMYTGKGQPSDRCDVGIPSGVNNTHRRYVIDESKGSVDLFMTFADNLPDSHEFRLEGGKLRYVHTLTVMGS